MTQGITTVTGQVYQIKLTIDNVVANGVKIIVTQTGANPQSGGFTTAGVHTFNFTASETTPVIAVFRDGACDVTISEVSCKVIVPTATNSSDIITIDGDIYFDDADWQGGSTAYKLLIKTADDSAPESKSITAVSESSIAGGTFDITVSGTFTATPQRDDIWAAGMTAFETRKYRIVNLRQTSDQKVEVTAVEYINAIYVND